MPVAKKAAKPAAKKAAKPAAKKAGLLHNALDDAKRQAEHARRILLAAGVW